MLKLVERHPEPQFTVHKETIENYKRTPFASDVIYKGPSLYSMLTHDASNYLECDLTLEIEEYDEKTVICHFPYVDDEDLLAAIGEDETLYGIVMIQFQMSILEQLFSFCANHYASKLVIYADDAQADVLGIYEDFLISQNESFTAQGKQTEMVIPAGRTTFEAWISFKEDVNLKFNQTLWQNQRSNPAIRQYLKYHPFG